ncbi:hypothetical protein FV222_00400 [Methylobacterium sp. WL103]|uniref:hypothetical protein n=1 Tax=Methylobacterium sp. WL103 TaxID=2603891 RepID=UPI0011C968F8|nr:hypothetical protein [Methylobacterium sp. WL103]TXN08965.1 hypothetical protein FV222_00400 [Methylobacterium sp. WL103]
MTLSITLGWWLLPSLLTVLALTWAFWERSTDHTGYLSGLAILFRLVVAVIVSLMIWIVYLVCVILSLS